MGWAGLGWARLCSVHLRAGEIYEKGKLDL